MPAIDSQASSNLGVNGNSLFEGFNSFPKFVVCRLLLG